MRHRSHHRNFESARSFNGGSCIKSRDVAGAARHESRFGTMCATHAKVHEIRTACSKTASCCFGGHDGLIVEQIDNPALDELCFRQWGRDPQYRFAFEEDVAFFHRIDVTS